LSSSVTILSRLTSSSNSPSLDTGFSALLTKPRGRTYVTSRLMIWQRA
jgi:hypothetical protein